MMLGLLWMIIRLVGYIIAALVVILLMAIALLLVIEGYIPWQYFLIGVILGMLRK